MICLRQTIIRHSPTNGFQSTHHFLCISSGYVQLGIDNFGCVQNGVQWHNDGGINAGRKWPVLFAGLVLNDSDMKAIGVKTGDYLYEVNGYGPENPPPDYIHFQEDDQTFYVTQEDIDRIHIMHPSLGYIPPQYSQSHLGMPEWGIRHSTLPTIDNPEWTTPYREGTTADAWFGWALAVLMMEETAGAKTLWNHDVLFDYMDRHNAINNGEPDPFGYTVPYEGTGGMWDPVFVEYMWDTYRDSY
jgi:hypothetical protein